MVVLVLGGEGGCYSDKEGVHIKCEERNHKVEQDQAGTQREENKRRKER